jgi:hypothetical protein
MKKWILVVAAALYVATVHQALAQSKTVTCTGTLIEVYVNPRWPLAVIYDAAGNYTCSVDRRGAGHDPIKPCTAGEKCRIVDTYRMFGDDKIHDPTYSIQSIETVENFPEEQK